MLYQNYKSETIEVLKKASNMYKDENIDITTLFNPKTCGLCKMYRVHKNCCTGCLFANEFSGPGCLEIKYFKDAFYYITTPLRYNYLIKLAKYIDKIIPIIEKYKKERFTPKGWRQFDKIII